MFILIGVIVFLLILAGISLYVVSQQEVYVIERLGKFRTISAAGIHFKNPLIDSIAYRLSLRVEQIVMSIETKTLDNVFVTLAVALQKCVDATPGTDGIFNAAYKLTNPDQQIGGYVFDIVRAAVPKLNLDDVFSKKDDIATEVKTSLEAQMKAYGIQIVSVLVTDIAPDEKVKASMNAINTAQRMQAANTAQGEADKILVVKQAEAQAESKRLQGVGIANERLAIAEGMKKAVAAFEGVSGVDPSEVLQTLLLTQYFDTNREMAVAGKSVVIFSPNNPGGLSSIADEIAKGVLKGNIGTVPLKTVHE